MLVNNGEERYQPFIPHATQIPVKNALNDDRYSTVVLACGRQWGKSKLARAYALKWAVENDNVTVLWLTPNTGQYGDAYKSILNGLISIDYVVSKKKARGDTEINLPNGSRILFRSAAQEDALRGFSVHYLIIDEAAFIDYSTISEMVLPMLGVAGRKKLIISTPKGKNWFYKWYNRGQSDEIEDIEYKSFRFSSWDNEHASESVLNGLKNELSAVEYDQEINAKFVDKASAFNNVEELSMLVPLEDPEKDGIYYCGIDIGLVGDATVACIIDKNGNLVNYYRYSKVKTPDLVNILLELNVKWNFRKILFELNNQGLPIYETLRTSMRNLVGFTTTSRSKSEIINNLIHLFNMKNILLVKKPKDSQLQRELNAFIFTQKDGGYVKYHSSSGEHDDCVVALAIARDCYERFRFNSEYLAFY